MIVISTLKHRAIRRLWCALAFSAVGDELYSVALVWSATASLGILAGYLIAIQAVSTLVATLFAGALADHRDAPRVMIASDLIRAVMVLPPVVWWLWRGENIPMAVLATTIVCVAGMKAFFDPSLQAFLPRLADDKDMLTAVNGLFDAMRRVARVFGPLIAAALLPFLPVVHLFTLDALTFVVSALAVASLRGKGQPVGSGVGAAVPARKGRAAFGAGFVALRKQPRMVFHFVAFGLGSGGWYLGLIMGTALFFRESGEGGSAFGLIIAAYGVGNVFANLLAAQFPARYPDRSMSFGRAISGLGFVAMGLVHGTPLMMLSAAVAAMGAPITQIPMTTETQTLFATQEIAPVYRVRMLCEWLGVLAALVVAPTVFSAIGPKGSMILSGSVYMAVALAGLLVFGGGPSSARSSRDGDPKSGVGA